MDVAGGHIKTQLLKLNEDISWILMVKRVLKMLKDHAKWTTSWQVKHAQECQLEIVHKKLKVWT